MIDKKKIIDQFIVGDIFCGIGGLSYGFKKQGFNVKFGIDLDSSCKYAFEQNNSSTFFQHDITELSPDQLNSYFPKQKKKILIGCAPCQSFSSYNSQIKKKEYLRKDEKWKLLYSFSNLIKHVQPDIISMENVPALETFKKGKVLNDFIESLEKEKYHVSYFIVFCPDYGIPQRRKRLILFASKFGKIKLTNKTHIPRNYKTVRQVIGHLAPISDGEGDIKDRLHKARKLNEINKQRIRATSEGGSWKEWNEKLLLDCHKAESGKSYGSVYGRMKWDDVAPTMTTQCTGLGNGRFGHPVQNRAISLREAAIFQTFPKKYKLFDPSQEFNFGRIETHIGNAVPVDLGKVISKSIKNHIITHLS